MMRAFSALSGYLKYIGRSTQRRVRQHLLVQLRRRRRVTLLFGKLGAAQAEAHLLGGRAGGGGGAVEHLEHPLLRRLRSGADAAAGELLREGERVVEHLV